MNLGNPQKPLTNLHLEFLSKRYGSDLDLKNKELGEIGKSNITRLYQILTEYKLESPFGKDIYNAELRKVLLESLSICVTVNTTYLLIWFMYSKPCLKLIF